MLRNKNADIREVSRALNNIAKCAWGAMQWADSQALLTGAEQPELGTSSWLWLSWLSYLWCLQSLLTFLQRKSATVQLHLSGVANHHNAAQSPNTGSVGE